jgi:hypothetical protein
MQTWDMRREIRKRTGDSRLLPGVGTYACKDGHVYMMVGVAGFGASWPVLSEWMAEEGMAEDLQEERWQQLLGSAGDLRAITALMTQPEKLAAMMEQFARQRGAQSLPADQDEAGTLRKWTAAASP